MTSFEQTRERLLPSQIAGDPFAVLMSRRRGSEPRGTERMRLLCHELGDPQTGLDVIHVVGTDGKTSVARITASMLTALGKQVGETTSPHLHDVTERLRLNGRAIAAEDLHRLADEVLVAIGTIEARHAVRISFFEAISAAALLWFARNRVDIAVVEAGIGGVHDATSVVDSRTVALTPVGCDHEDILGPGAANIAREKAGVIATGGTLVSAQQRRDVAGVVAAVTSQRCARLLVAGHDFHVDHRRSTPFGQHVVLRGVDGVTVDGVLPLRGAHQAANAVQALATIQAHLRGAPVDTTALARGLESVALGGRGEVVACSDQTLLVFDGAHDALSAQALARTVIPMAAQRRLVVVVGMTGDRNPGVIADAFGSAADALIVTNTSTPSRVPASRLRAQLNVAGYQAHLADDVTVAIRHAREQLGAEVVVVTGSLYLVGEARRGLVELAGMPAAMDMRA
ncbi:MAG: Mur ligase family protein [Nitriliruptoraceae bacterium]